MSSANQPEAGREDTDSDVRRILVLLRRLEKRITPTDPTREGSARGVGSTRRPPKNI